MTVAIAIFLGVCACVLLAYCVLVFRDMWSERTRDRRREPNESLVNRRRR